MNITQALNHSQAYLAEGESPRIDAERLLEYVLSKPRAYLYTWPEVVLESTQLAMLDACLERRKCGEPIAYIVGVTDFWTLTLSVSPHTLIPRPDTEVLVEQVLAQDLGQGLKVLDLGTGTGAIALALAKEQPSWQICGVDKISEAVVLAEKNAAANGVSNARFCEGSWFEPVAGYFDLIVSNPPYIDGEDQHLEQGDVRFEPRSALVAPEQGLADIRMITGAASHYLNQGGWLYFEHGYDQAEGVQRLLTDHGYQLVETIKDYAGNDRVTRAQWSGEDLYLAPNLGKSYE